MRAADVQNYHRQVYAEEVAALNACRFDLAKAVREMPGMRAGILTDAIWSEEYVTEWTNSGTSPRPSLAIAHIAFGAIAENPQRQAAVDGASEALNDFIFPVASLAPKRKARVALAHLDATTDHIYCADSEDRFVDAIHGVENGSLGEHRIVSVYHNAAREPVAIRKDYAESTALLLKPHLMGKLHLPVGTIVSIGQDSEDHPVEITGVKPTVDGDTLTTYEVDSLPLTPGRISLWAYRFKKQRALFAFDGFSVQSFYDDREVLVTGTTINDFRRTAAHIMRSCGVEPA